MARTESSPRSNPTTGEYHILKIASAYDVGKAINPELSADSASAA